MIYILMLFDSIHYVTNDLNRLRNYLHENNIQYEPTFECYRNEHEFYHLHAGIGEDIHNVYYDEKEQKLKIQTI